MKKKDALYLTKYEKYVSKENIMNCYNEILRLKLKYGSGIKLSVDGVELLADEFLENGILKEFIRDKKINEILK